MLPAVRYAEAAGGMTIMNNLKTLTPNSRLPILRCAGSSLLLALHICFVNSAVASSQAGEASAAHEPPPAKPITLMRPELAAPPAPSSTPQRPVLPDQFVLLDGEKHLYGAFSRLASFPFEITPDMAATNAGVARQCVLDALPSDVRALDGRALAIVGFIQPGTVVDGKVKDFLLVSHLDSCLGQHEPQINHKVLVRMTGEGADFVEKLPAAAVGTFRLGPVTHEGQLMFIYQMDADRVVPASRIEFPQPGSQ